MGSTLITDEGVLGVPCLSVIHEDRVGAYAEFYAGTVCAPALASIMALGGRRLEWFHPLVSYRITTSTVALFRPCWTILPDSRIVLISS